MGAPGARLASSPQEDLVLCGDPHGARSEEVRPHPVVMLDDRLGAEMGPIRKGVTVRGHGDMKAARNEATTTAMT